MISEASNRAPRRHVRRSVAPALASVAAIVAAVVGAGVASAGVVSKRVRAPVEAAGLSPAERDAVTVRSLQATDDPALGLIVTVTFKGDAERYLGQGPLRHALLALVVNPKSPKPAEVIDEGGGFARSGGMDLFGREQVLTVHAGQKAGVIRDRNRVIFHLGGPRLSQLSAVQLKLFVDGPGGAGKPPTIAHRVLEHRPSALSSLKVDTRKLGCVQLAAARDELAGLLSGGLEPQLRSLVRAPRSGSHRAVGIHRLKTEIASGKKLIEQVDALIDKCAQRQVNPPQPAPAAEIVQTDPSLSQYMAAQPSATLSTTPPTGVPLIDVNDQLRYQQFNGIGAAMTDSSAWLIEDQLSSRDRRRLIDDLFTAAGIHLNFLRVPMAASDFTVSSQPYSYDDMPAGQSDPSLSHFSIAHDLPYIIPALRETLSANPAIRILANPWSPPAWMKSNDSMDNQNAQGTLLSSAYGPLANYFVKFIQAYQSKGVRIDAVTPQNEPRSGGAGTSYPGLTLPEPDQANFISGYLQPALSAAGLATKIYGDDNGWDSASSYADPLATGSAAGYLSGIAWHCYFGLPTVMTQLHQSAPGLDQIADECSPEIRNFKAPEYLISSLRNWASVASVWNVALDPQGGPKEPANGCPGCTGVVTIDEQSHQVTLTNEYYQLGQVSSFVQPGATRIDSPNFVTYTLNSSGIETVSPGLDDVAFLNPDGSKVLVAHNTSSAAISFAVQSDGRYFTYNIPANAMTTFVWR